MVESHIIHHQTLTTTIILVHEQDSHWAQGELHAELDRYLTAGEIKTHNSQKTVIASKLQCKNPMGVAKQILYRLQTQFTSCRNSEFVTNLWREEEVCWSAIKSPQSTKESPDFKLQWENADAFHDCDHFCWILPSMPHCRWPLSTYISVSSTHESNKTNEVELYSIQIPCWSDHFIALNNTDVSMGFLSTTGQMSHHTESLGFSRDEKQTYLRISNQCLPESNRHTIFLPLAAKSRLRVKNQHIHKGI